MKLSCKHLKLEKTNVFVVLVLTLSIFVCKQIRFLADHMHKTKHTLGAILEMVISYKYRITIF